MSVEYPDRIELARTPTPLQHLERASQRHGVELHIKRDDLTGAALSGNKIRKLEFLLADAIASGADTVITCGGEQSNHCRATAVAATRMGLQSVLLLRTVDPENPPPATGNILLNRLVGATIVWISHAEYARRTEIFARETARLRANGNKPYVIPEGGSNAVGSWGYVRCVEEIIADLSALPSKPTTIVHACGSGGTSAGLVLGARLHGLADRGVSLACVNVCDDRAYFVDVIDRICGEFAERYNVGAGSSAADIEIVEGYVGRGYAKTQPQELEALAELARSEAVILDPVYSGKAFFGMATELARDPSRFGERIVFIHTGGIFGLLAKAATISGSLS